MQLDVLWDFMQADMEADRFENDMRQAPNRQKLLKDRNFLVEQQNNMKKIEADVVAMGERIAALTEEVAKLEGVVDAQREAIAVDPPETVEEIEKQSGVIQKLFDSLARHEQELQKMRKDAETRDRQQKEIRVRAAKAKAEYDALKKVYDVEFKADSQKLQELRAKAERDGKRIEAALLERYKAIKQHVTPPMATLVGDQCGGCYMSLPSATMRQIKAGESIVECDNCGRILFVKE